MTNQLNVPRMALAFGITAAIAYGGCMLVMAVSGKEQLVFLFNSLLHGFNVESIIATDVPLATAAMGIVETFIVAWLVGALIAAIYNFGIDSESTHE